MKQAIIIMTLMGCDHGERNCVYIETASQSYHSESACMTASEREILATAHSPYPVIMAQCSAQNTGHVQADAAVAPAAQMPQSAASISTDAIRIDDTVPTLRSTNMLRGLKQFGENARLAVWQTAVRTTQFVNPF